MNNFDAFIIFGFVTIFFLYMLVIIYIAIKTMPSSDSPKRKKRYYQIIVMIFFTIFITISLIAGYFFSTTDIENNDHPNIPTNHNQLPLKPDPISLTPEN
jgi:hypothetical protein